MKRELVLQSLICLLVMSCSVHEPDISQADMVYYVTLESYADPGTRVYVDEKVKLHWEADDRFSLFRSTLNEQWRFTGNTGDDAGEITSASSQFGTGADIDFRCAVYPYQSSTKIDNKNNVLKLTLPEKQTYREGSFGRGANMMVSVTEENDNLLNFKNIGGYMVFNFYGDGVSVSSIRIEGRNGEFLSGEATLAASIGDIPKIVMASTAGTSITLSCDDIALDASEEKATEFWMVVPPTTFTKGFKLTVTGADGKEFVRESDKELSVVRNTVLRVAPLELSFD
jgi:hypothetical protein